MRALTRSPMLQQLVKFGLVGGVGFVVDTAVYNLLVLTVLAPQHWHEGPLVAKVCSTIVAIFVNWMGNRYWAFGPHRSANSVQEGIEFFAVSLLGMGIQLLPLWVTHYLIGWTSLLMDNIANIIGLGFGSIIRFALYRYWVYQPSRVAARAARDEPALSR